MFVPLHAGAQPHIGVHLQCAVLTHSHTQPLDPTLKKRQVGREWEFLCFLEAEIDQFDMTYAVFLYISALSIVQPLL